MSQTATCNTCGKSFEVDPSLATRFPGWTPSQCQACFKKGSTRKGGGSANPRRSGSVEQNMTTADVLNRYHDGPANGVFTDGSASPNPGPGGWGAVLVRDGEMMDRVHGHEPATTNNRMELMALSAGIDLIAEGAPTTIYSDSRLVVDTVTKWAYGWERKKWKRKGGPIKNLDLVKPLFAKVKDRPEITVEWIAAHSGNRWNEYADSLSTAYLRDEI